MTKSAKKVKFFFEKKSILKNEKKLQKNDKKMTKNDQKMIKKRSKMALCYVKNRLEKG